tara:strand:+ start:11532 stop:11726 length:195 start_codon:yes stop_codon:yes gene_type:complete
MIELSDLRERRLGSKRRDADVRARRPAAAARFRGKIVESQKHMRVSGRNRADAIESETPSALEP